MRTRTEVRVAVPCSIGVQDPKAKSKLHALAYDKLHSDGYGVTHFRCSDCGQEWDYDPLSAWEGRACPNCYSDKTRIVRLRLLYESWGKQNGGKAERDVRVDVALTHGGVIVGRSAFAVEAA